jgi:hypothetical protein
MFSRLRELASRALEAYLAQLAARPFAVNAATGAVIAAAGDAACQAAIPLATGAAAPPYDWRRTAEMAAVRAAFMGPFLTLYFPWLAARAPGTSARAVATRLVIDQVVGAPLTISATFALVALLQGRPETALPRIREQLLPSLAVSACYWPLVHSINFSRVPVRHQPLTTHFAALLWQAYLSYHANVALEGETSKGGKGEVPPARAAAAPAAAVA